MAGIILSSNNVKAVHALGLLWLVLSAQKGAAYMFTVGNQKGWSVPSDPNSNPYNQWAEQRRFQTGDSLVFKYQAGQDSVLQVKSEDYASCNTDAPIGKYSDGYTVFTFNQSGPHYFISGNKDNCNKNEKLVVVVLADRSKNQTASPPPPSTSPELAPSPAPTAQETPSPSPPPSSSPPTGQETPSSPPSSPPTEQATPSPPSSAPATETPPPSAASSVLIGFAGIGAFMASSVVLSF